MASKSVQQWQRFIREAALASGRVVFTRHAITRMRSRQITTLMVLQVLRNGTIRRVPEPNTAKGTLECRMEYFLAGRQIAVVAAVSDDNPDVIVVTAMEL